MTLQHFIPSFRERGYARQLGVMSLKNVKSTPELSSADARRPKLNHCGPLYRVLSRNITSRSFLQRMTDKLYRIIYTFMIYGITRHIVSTHSYSFNLATICPIISFLNQLCLEHRRIAVSDLEL